MTAMTAPSAPTMTTAVKAGGRDRTGTATEATAAPARLQADSRPVVLAATWLVAGLAGAAFVMGVPGLLLVGEWAGLPRHLRPLVPVVLDAGLVVMAVAAVVRRARRESAAFAMGSLAVLTALSVSAQVAHVVVPAAAITGEVIGGAVAAAVAPLVVFASTHVLLDLAIAPAPARRRARKPDTAARPAPRAIPSSAPSATANPKPAASVPAPEVKPRKTAVASAGRDELRAEVLRLRAEGLSFARIAEATGVPTSTVKRWAAASSR